MNQTKGPYSVRFGIVILALSCAGSCLTAGQAVTPSPPGEQNSAAAQASSPSAEDVRTIELDAVVTDKSGTPIAGLKAEDFTLLDNKQRQAVSVVEAGVTNKDVVEAYVLIDTINPHVTTVANERRDLTAWLQRTDRIAVPISLVFLTTDGLKIQGQPTLDPKILLANLENNPTTVRTFHDTGYYSAEAVREKCLMAMNVLAVKLAKRPGRKLVIWISPGWAEFIMQSSRMSRKDQEELFSYEASLSVALRIARITLYSVDPNGAECVTCSRNSYYKNYLKGPYTAGDADHNDLLLQALAAKSGGRVLTGKNDIAAMVAECMTDAQNYYVLTFAAPPAAQRTTFHEVKVEVDKPGSQVRTRSGYYSLAQAEAEKANQ